MEHVLSIMAFLETGLGRQADLALVNLIMLIIVVAPLCMLPFLMKTIGGLAQTIGVAAQGRGKGFVNRARGLGEKAGGAQKSYYQRKGTEYAAKNFDARKNRLHNIPSMIAARKLGVTRDQQTALGAAADKFERDKIERAQQYFSQMGIKGDKDQLRQEFNKMKDPYDRMAAADLIGDAGGMTELEEMFKEGDAGQRMAIAKAAASNKTVGQQDTGFADQAKAYLEEMNKPNANAGNAYTASQADRKTKTDAKFNANYLMNQKAKPEILNDVRDYLDDDQRLANTLEKAKKDPATSAKFGKAHQQLLDDLYSSGSAQRPTPQQNQQPGNGGPNQGGNPNPGGGGPNPGGGGPNPGGNP